MPAPSLYKHQEKTIEFALPLKAFFDMSDAGTGKTRVQIEIFTRRRDQGMGCALVLANKTLLYAAWAADFKKYAPDVRVSVATASNREKAFAAHADVYITNHDAVNWLAKQPASFFKRFSSLIIDESSAFKHRTSGRSKAISKIKKYFTYRTCMSATPSTNSVTELWHQALILDDGARLGKSFFNFRSAVQNAEQVGPQANMLKWMDRPGAAESVALLMQDITIRHKLEECLDMPELVMHSIGYTLSPRQVSAYKQMEAACIAELRAAGKVISAVNAAGVMGKLLQIASGAAYAEDGSMASISDDRYELIADLIEERESTVVFFNWTHQLHGLRNTLMKRGITFTEIHGGIDDKARLEAVEHFQAGFYEVTLAHPASAAHGVTLTRGTTTIWASPTYNLEHYIQGNRRTYRAGQTRRCEIINILAHGTVEDKVYQVLNDKYARQGTMLGLLEELTNDSA